MKALHKIIIKRIQSLREPYTQTSKTRTIQKYILHSRKNMFTRIIRGKEKLSRLALDDSSNFEEALQVVNLSDGHGNQHKRLKT